MKVGILVNLKHGHAYEEIAKAAELGFTNGQLNVWDQKLHDEESIAEVKRACKGFFLHRHGSLVWLDRTYRLVLSESVCNTGAGAGRMAGTAGT